VSEPQPTGLDYHAAYQVCYPASYAQGVRIQDISDTQLKLVDRVARLVAKTRADTIESMKARGGQP
jgi:hypothetical protein